MVDKENGEIWHFVDGKTNKPAIRYPKAHSWKTSLHSFEHALFGYMTASRIKGEKFELYYDLPEWEKLSYKTVSPYIYSLQILSRRKPVNVWTLCLTEIRAVRLHLIRFIDLTI